MHFVGKLVLLLLPVWCSGNALDLINVDQRSYCMLSPVSARVRDCLLTSKPPPHRTRHPGRLSLSSPSVVRLE